MVIKCFFLWEKFCLPVHFYLVKRNLINQSWNHFRFIWKRYLFFAELAMSQRWCAIFCATSAWGLISIRGISYVLLRSYCCFASMFFQFIARLQYLVSDFCCVDVCLVASSRSGILDYFWWISPNFCTGWLGKRLIPGIPYLFIQSGAFECKNRSKICLFMLVYGHIGSIAKHFIRINRPPPRNIKYFFLESRTFASLLSRR